MEESQEKHLSEEDMTKVNFTDSDRIFYDTIDVVDLAEEDTGRPS